ncbi:MAG TPA: hypothetical protein VLF69_00965 [Candidatus Saccharimonadales bacterium]|nr:hypothetical protein [Candidatus Saccharimonadales bacterium]
MHRLCSERAQLDVALADPAALTFDLYQAAAWQQVLVDEPADLGHATVKGLPLEAWFFLGLREEYGEAIQIDTDPEHAVRMLYDGRAHSLPYNRGLVTQMLPYEYHQRASAAAKDYHGKEFGDLMWHVANTFTRNRLRLQVAAERGIQRLGGTVALGETITDFDAALNRLNGKDVRNAAGWFYMTAVPAFIDAAENMLRSLPEAHAEAVNQQRRCELMEAAAPVLGFVSLVLQTRLDTTLSHTLYDNLQKVEGRTRRGTAVAAGALGRGDKR